MKKFIQGLSIIFIILGMFGCTAQQPVASTTEAATPATENTATLEDVAMTTTATPNDEKWWENAIFYQVFVRSFYDANGNGIGDFAGLTEKLDYLNDGDPTTTTDLGITGIWLMPIFTSPSYHGYDVTNYYNVNGDYGTFNDFLEFLDQAHQRGIHVIIDFVINHTSNQHPWFVQALGNHPQYKDYYVWSTTKPAYAGPWGQSVWYRVPELSEYYYAVFWDGMPDLNFDNPQVTEELYKITDFWLGDIGVDGFRIDAARYLYADGSIQADTANTKQWFKDWRQYYEERNPDAFTIGEVWTDLKFTTDYAQGDGMDSVFAFSLADAIINGVNTSNAGKITFGYTETLRGFDRAQFGAFVTNHDLPRLMTAVIDNPIRARLAAFVYLTGPGIPFIYYGEEIGKTGVSHEEVRTPMFWSSDANAGFTSNKPWSSLEADWQEKNVETQAADPDSLYNFYRNLLTLRQAHPALQNTSTYKIINANHVSLYTVLRYSDDEIIITLANLNRKNIDAVEIALAAGPMEAQTTYTLEYLWGEGDLAEITTNAQGGFDSVEIKPGYAPGEMLVIKLVKK